MRRGAHPLGGGEIAFSCSTVDSLQAISFTDLGSIKRIRGIRYPLLSLSSATTRISPQTSNRLIESARSMLNTFIPDIYIFSDVFKGDEAGKSSGFSLSLVAESTTDALYGADLSGKPGETPEEVGKRCALLLLKQIDSGGVYSVGHEWFPLILMALSDQNLSKLRVSENCAKADAIFSDITHFMGVGFKLKADPASSKSLLVSCIGSGCINHNRRIQ